MPDNDDLFDKIQPLFYQFTKYDKGKGETCDYKEDFTKVWENKTEFANQDE